MREALAEKGAVRWGWSAPVRRWESAESEAWPAPCARRPAPSSRPARKARRESSYPRRRSIAVSITRDQFRSAYLQGFASVDFLQPRQEIRPPGGNLRLGGDQPGDDPLALGDLNLFAFTEKIFDLPKPVAQVAHGSFSHVIHFGITLKNTQYTFKTQPNTALDIRFLFAYTGAQ